MNKISGYLGMAARARKIAAGHIVMDLIRSRQAKLVICTLDASDRTRKQISDKCRYYSVPYYSYGESTDISSAIGKNNVKVIALTDQNLAEAVRNELERGEVV